MGHQNQGRTQLRIQMEQQIDDRAAGAGVEIARGFVSHDDGWTHDKCASYGHALLLEANHDPDMLAASGYPAFLKRRIAGVHGHLANHDAAGILAAVRHTGLNRVVAAHLSAQNNQPRLAQQALAHALDWPAEGVDIASPTKGTDWIHVV